MKKAMLHIERARRAIAKRSFGAMVHFQVGQKVHCVPAMGNALLADMRAEGYDYYAKIKWVPDADPIQVKCPQVAMSGEIIEKNDHILKVRLKYEQVYDNGDVVMRGEDVFSFIELTQEQVRGIYSKTIRQAAEMMDALVPLNTDELQRNERGRREGFSAEDHAYADRIAVQRQQFERQQRDQQAREEEHRRQNARKRGLENSQE